MFLVARVARSLDVWFTCLFSMLLVLTCSDHVFSKFVCLFISRAHDSCSDVLPCVALLEDSAVVEHVVQFIFCRCL